MNSTRTELKFVRINNKVIRLDSIKKIDLDGRGYKEHNILPISCVTIYYKGERHAEDNPPDHFFDDEADALRALFSSEPYTIIGLFIVDAMKLRQQFQYLDNAERVVHSPPDKKLLSE